MAFALGLDRTWPLGMGLLVILGGAAWIRSEDPSIKVGPRDSEVVDPPANPLENPPAGEFPPQPGFVPSIEDSKKIPEHVANDPVFQELSKAFLGSNQVSQAVRFSPSGTSDSVWHAIENTLRTARQLEAEEARLKALGELEKAKKHREIINNLRLQGAKLLANEMQITIS
ncbi:MAG: hypothetical protein MUC43_17100 [Pirellula sp.]|nr:hypothetical protein [Pirellula sp.]